MNEPKISVLIPMYNRKHCVEHSIDSVFSQTFRDFEVIVRDDGSTDGSADFVAEKYADEISSGRLKLRRNEKNIGEFPTDNRLLREASGKYIMILHSDDLYLPHALEYMYSVAEHFQADVVHSGISFLINFDGPIKDGLPVTIVPEKKLAEEVTLMPADKESRLNEWLDGNIHVDAQYNIFRRSFLAENDLRFYSFGGNALFSLCWLLKVKVFVKTPVYFYVYRNSPDSVSNAKPQPGRVAKFVSEQIELSRYLDEFFAEDDFFRDNPVLQYRVRNHLFSAFSHWDITHRGVYKHGITPELHAAVEGAFKKHFGDDAALPTVLFHLIHAVIYGYFTDTPPRSVDREFPEAA